MLECRRQLRTIAMASVQMGPAIPNKQACLCLETRHGAPRRTSLTSHQKAHYTWTQAEYGPYSTYDGCFLTSLEPAGSQTFWKGRRSVLGACETKARILNPFCAMSALGFLVKLRDLFFFFIKK